MVAVYNFAIYDIAIDEMQTSKRMATREAIMLVGGAIVESSALEVDPVHVGAEIPGMTARGFGAHSLRQPGSQRTVS